MSKPPWQWDESDLEKLIGEPENLRLEFKSGRLLEKQPDEVAQDLSKEVSAFANTEGGVLVVGMAEKAVGKTGPRIADALDGAPPGLFAPERLQRIVEGNLSPYLPGIRLRPVKLPKLGDRVAFVLVVPAGNTAYQAADRRYYGRSEYEAKALPDHEIRLRMARGRTPAVELVGANPRRHRTAEEVLEAKRSTLAKDLGEIAKALGESGELGEEKARTFDPNGFFGEGWERRFFSEYAVDLSLRNVGEVTVRDYEFVATVSVAPGFLCSVQEKPQPHDGFGVPQGSQNVELTSRMPQPAQNRGALGPKLWPGAELKVERLTLLVPWGGMLADSNMIVKWKVFLDDAPPSEGDLSWKDIWT